MKKDFITKTAIKGLHKDKTIAEGTKVSLEHDDEQTEQLLAAGAIAHVGKGQSADDEGDEDETPAAKPNKKGK